MPKHILILLLFATSASAQPCRLVKDIHTGDSYGSQIVYADLLTVADNHLFFSGAECTQSPEVYAIDALADSIYLPKNVWQESGWFWCGTDPTYWLNSASKLTSVGNQVFYVLDHSDFGRELWKSDGSYDGTLLMGDIFPGIASSNPDLLTPFKDYLWFAATDAAHGRELWYSDGTAANTQMLADLFPGLEGAEPSNLAASENYLYFTAKTPTQGNWLFRTDGTPAGIEAIIALTVPGTLNVQPVSLQVVDDIPYWVLRDDVANTANLFRMDMQTMQPLLLQSFYSVSYYSNHIPSKLTKAGNGLFFAANTYTTGRELWITDGTPDGTKQVADLAPGQTDAYPEDLISFNDTLYFGARIDGKEKLCRSDGTANSTFALDIPAMPSYSGVEHLTVWNGYLWFVSPSTLNNNMLRSNGTGAGTEIAMTGINIRDMAVWNNALYFIGLTDATTIWKFSGVPGSQPQRLKGNGNTGNSSNNAPFARMRDRVYFWASIEDNERQLWSSDGNDNGTFYVTDLEITTNGTGSAPMVINDSLLIFYSFTWPTGNELWRSDGNPGSETMITDLNPGSSGSIAQFGRSDGRYVYFISGGGLQNSLYRTDGSEAGTILLKSGINGIGQLLVHLNGIVIFKVYFQGDTWLLKTDGSPTGTQIITKIQEQQVTTIPENLVVMDSMLFFIKENDDETWGLWKTDGSIAGTSMAAQLNPADVGSPNSLTAAGEQMFLMANDGVSGNELWISDGTQDGTQIVADITPGAAGTTVYYMTGLGETLLFVYQDSIHGIELWTSDGTADGTVLLKDIVPGAISSAPQITLLYSTVIDSLLFFSAFTEDFGRELWQTDGTADGTFMVQDICPGPCSSSPKYLFPVPAQRFFFTTYSPEWGIEPWIYDPFNTSAVRPQPESSNGSDFIIFPNPNAQNTINLVWEKDVTPSNVQVFDLHGRELVSQTVEYAQHAYTLFLPELPTGLYFVKMNDQQGRLLGIEKLLIQKN